MVCRSTDGEVAVAFSPGGVAAALAGLLSVDPAPAGAIAGRALYDGGLDAKAALALIKNARTA